MNLFNKPLIHSEESNLLQCKLGRLLSLGVEFECSCHILAANFKARFEIQKGKEISENDIRRIFKNVGDNLGERIKMIRGFFKENQNQSAILETLNIAREARNKAVHDLPIGYVYGEIENNMVTDVNTIQEYAEKIATGIIMAQVLSMALQSENIPDPEEGTKKMHRLVEWVVGDA